LTRFTGPEFDNRTFGAPPAAPGGAESSRPNKRLLNFQNQIDEIVGKKKTVVELDKETAPRRSGPDTHTNLYRRGGCGFLPGAPVALKGMMPPLEGIDLNKINRRGVRTIQGDRSWDIP